MKKKTLLITAMLLSIFILLSVPVSGCTVIEDMLTAYSAEKHDNDNNNNTEDKINYSDPANSTGIYSDYFTGEDAVGAIYEIGGYEFRLSDYKIIFYTDYATFRDEVYDDTLNSQFCDYMLRYSPAVYIKVIYELKSDSEWASFEAEHQSLNNDDSEVPVILALSQETYTFFIGTPKIYSIDFINHRLIFNYFFLTDEQNSVDDFKEFLYLPTVVDDATMQSDKGDDFFSQWLRKPVTLNDEDKIYHGK